LFAVWILAISWHGGPLQTAGTKAGQPESFLYLGLHARIIRRGFFTRRGDFNARKDSITRLIFCRRKDFVNPPDFL
jgi:hypothetical protein